MNSIYPSPVVMLVPDKSGFAYRPANAKAEAIAELLGVAITDRHLPLIEASGLTVMFPNEEPIPFPPNAYRVNKWHVEPRHVKDDA